MRERNRTYFKSLVLFIKSPLGAFSISALLGFIVFGVYFGYGVVVPTNTDWLLVAGGDLKQHYLGWEFYRFSDLMFPLGQITGFAYPYGLPITYVDALPLLAVPFKLISGILPEHFQYFGVWTLLCCMLQGGFAGLILRRWTKNSFVILLGSLIFILSPTFILRTFNHTALASQWIILAAIWLMIEWRSLQSRNWRWYVVWWGTLFVVAFLVHPYFVPMIFIFLLSSVILSHKNWLRSILTLSLPLLAGVAAFALVGGFALKETATGGLGLYSTHLLSAFDPLGWSKVAEVFGYRAAGSAESLSYLGLGIILMAPVTFYLLLRKAKSYRGIGRLLKSINPRYWLVGLLLVGAFVFSLSPEIKIGNRVVFDLNPPAFIESIWSIFRATGRIFWPVYYLIIVVILVGFINFSKRGFSGPLLASLLAVFVAIQVIDVGTSSQSIGKRTFVSSINKAYQASYDQGAWGAELQGKSHIVLLDDYMGKIETLESLNEALVVTEIAADHKTTINAGYYARAPWNEIKMYQEKQRTLLKSGAPIPADTLYLTKDARLAESIENNTAYKMNRIQDYYAISLP